MANEFLAKMTRFQPKNSWKIKSITLDQYYTPFIRWPLIFKSIFLHLYVQNLQESCKIFSLHLLSVWIIDCSSLSNLRLHAVEQSLWEEQKRENVWQNRLSSDNDWAFFISFLKCIYILCTEREVFAQMSVGFTRSHNIGCCPQRLSHQTIADGFPDWVTVWKPIWQLEHFKVIVAQYPAG